MRRFAAVLLVCVACDSPPVVETFRSGERLKLQLWESDGLRIPLFQAKVPQLFDETRQESCSPVGYQNAATIQCLPDAHTRAVYTDAACTQPAAIRPAATVACDPCYAITLDPSHPVLRLTGPSTATQYYERLTTATGTECIGPKTGRLDDVVVLAADEFAALQQTEPSGDGPVLWSYFESADGLHLVWPFAFEPTTLRPCDWLLEDDGTAACWDGGTQQMYATATATTSRERLRPYRSDDELLPFLIYDASLASECVFRHASDGSWRCIEQMAGFRPAFADPQCTIPNQVIVTALNGLSLIPRGWSQDGHVWTTQPTGPAYDNFSGPCVEILFPGDTPTGYLSPNSDVTDDYVGVTVEIDH
ncbi:MAG TPA: hypothetical protein VFQ53_37905 [Kofleriaceae bacterium]|nr:hypothetical protein [Kofleriaceae bacterium]